MRVAIRVDASRAIGTGHVRRCLALAAALRDVGAEPFFIARTHDLDVTAMVEPHGYALHLLPRPEGPQLSSAVPHGNWAGVTPERDAEETAHLARGAGWIVIDHYGFYAAWHRPAREATGARIAVVDDLADRPLAGDLIVDHNHHPDHRAKYAQVAAGTPILGGPRFALLGPAYAAAERYRPRDEVRSIGIFMGGVDRDDVTSLVLDALDGLAVGIEVVTTSGNPHVEALRNRPGITLSVDLPDLAAFYARHDLQIGAGGGASWERCCIGAPTLLLAVAANQQEVVPHLAGMGAVATCAVEKAAIRAEVEALIADPARRRALSETARMLADGLGARRVALRIARESLRVRPAARADAELMHAWRDHPATRAVSRDDRAIAFADHLAWLERTLADPQRSLLIAQIGRVPVGVIRFDRLDDARCEVSLYLDPALHGLGLGTQMLLAGERSAARGLDIAAEVLEGNEASGRMFAAAGYRPDGPNHWIKPAAGRA